MLTCPLATVVFAEPGGERLTGNGVVVIPLRSCYFYFNLSSLRISAQQSFDCDFIFLFFHGNILSAFLVCPHHPLTCEAVCHPPPTPTPRFLPDKKPVL